MDYLLASWNLENLFAPEHHPGREEWIAKAVARELAGWTPELFQRKVDQLAAVASGFGAGEGADLLAVCEVENAFALAELARALNGRLPARDYRKVHADATRDRRGVDTAFLYDASRLEPVAGETFSHFVMRRTGTRDITQQTFRTAAGIEFVAFANHWPSRSGGHKSESAGFRATAGETLGYWHERIRDVKGRDTAVIALGDFNDEPGDPSITIHARSTRERDDVESATSARFYNLSWNYLRQEAVTRTGRRRTLYRTLYWKGNGYVFDQILVSRALLAGSGPLQVVEETACMETPAVMVNRSKNSGPIRFGLPRGDAGRNVNPDGYSDHFPVSVVIRER